MLVGGMKRASRNREAEVQRYKGGEDVPLDAMCQGDKLAAASGLESMTAPELVASAFFPRRGRS